MLSRGRIAVVQNLPLGGGRKLMTWLVKSLLLKNFKIDVYGPPLSSRDKNFGTNLDLKNNNIHYFAQKWMIPAKKLNTYRFLIHAKNTLPAHYALLARNIGKRKYDAVLAFSDYIVGSPPIFKFIKCKKIYIVFEPKREYQEKTYWSTVDGFIKNKLWTKMTAFIHYADANNVKYADKIYTISNFASESLKNYYHINSQKIVWHYPGLPLNYFQHVNNDLSLSLPKVFFASIGSVNYLKGYDFLIKSLALTKYKKIPLYIVANGGKDVARIYKLAKRNNIKIHILSYVTEPILVTLLANSKLFLYSPRNEPLGLGLLEAIYLGANPLVVNEGGPGEISTLLDISHYPRNEHIFALAIEKHMSKGSKLNTDIKKLMKYYFNLDKYVKYLERLIFS